VGSPRYRATEHRWEVRIDLEPVGGRRKQKSFYGATKDAAVKPTREYMHGLGAGQAPAPAALKVGRYLEDWLATVQVMPSNRGRYSGVVHNQMITRLGAT